MSIFTDACWTFMEKKQWMWAQWGSRWCVSALVKQYWVTSAGAGFDKHSMQALVHRWWKCRASATDCIEKIGFCSWEFALSYSVIKLFVVVFMKTNRRHYFQSSLHTSSVLVLCKWTVLTLLLFFFFLSISFSYLPALLIYDSHMNLETAAKVLSGFAFLAGVRKC